MKINLNFFLILLVLLITTISGAQVGIGTFNPDESSILDIFSDSKGLLMPRLSTAQRDAIVLPASGLMIYNYTENDGQLNTGTPTVPSWVGIKKSEYAAIDTVTKGGSTSTSSIVSLLVEGMILSPLVGSYLVLFNAQSVIIETFTSNSGVNATANLYNELKEFPGGVSHILTFGSGEILSPGIYDVTGAPSIAGILTLDGGGNSNSVFIIRGTGAFTTGVGTTVLLINNAQPENIFWVSHAAMSTGANTIMKGTMLGGGTGDGPVSLGAGSNLEGRLLTKLGAITVGADVVITTPSASSSVSLGMLSTFAMWSSSGAVSDVATSTITGDVGTAAGALTIAGTHNGNAYPAGVTGSTINNMTTYSIYQNGVEVVNSSRTVNLPSGIVSLQAKVDVLTGDSIEIRWKVNQGSSRLNHRTISMISLD